MNNQENQRFSTPLNITIEVNMGYWGANKYGTRRQVFVCIQDEFIELAEAPIDASKDEIVEVAQKLIDYIFWSFTAHADFSLFTKLKGWQLTHPKLQGVMEFLEESLHDAALDAHEAEQDRLNETAYENGY